MGSERLRMALAPLRGWPERLEQVAGVFADIAQLLQPPRDAELGVAGSTYQMAMDASVRAAELGNAIRTLHATQAMSLDDLERLCSVRDTTRVLKATAGIALSGWPGQAHGVLPASLRGSLASAFKMLNDDMLPVVSALGFAPMILRRAAEVGMPRDPERRR